MAVPEVDLEKIDDQISTVSRGPFPRFSVPPFLSFHPSSPLPPPFLPIFQVIGASFSVFGFMNYKLLLLPVSLGPDQFFQTTQAVFFSSQPMTRERTSVRDTVMGNYHPFLLWCGLLKGEEAFATPPFPKSFPSLSVRRNFRPPPAFSRDSLTDPVPVTQLVPFLD